MSIWWCKFKFKLEIAEECFYESAWECWGFKKNYILLEIPKTCFMDFGLLYENDKGEYVVLNDVRMADIRLASFVYLLVYVSTYCVPIALLRQNKPFPLLYLGHAQIIIIISSLLTKNSSNPFRIRMSLTHLELKRYIRLHTPVLPSKTIPDSRPKWTKCIHVFRPKRPKTCTLWGGTYLYDLYKGVPPGCQLNVTSGAMLKSPRKCSAIWS